MNHFNDFHSLVRESHHLPTDMPFTVSYTDPRNSDLLPINNDDNLMRAFTTSMPLLSLIIYRKQGGKHVDQSPWVLPREGRGERYIAKNIP